MTCRTAAWLLTASCVWPAACGGGTSREVDAGSTGGGLNGPVVVSLDTSPPALLSEYKLFTWSPASGFAFNDRVVPYDVNTALFSDYALKQRAIYIPEGAAMTFDAEQPLDLPVGAVVIKTFYYPADARAPDENLRLVETRLLIRHPDGWHPLPYIWNAEQRDAVLTPAGEVRPISFVDATGASQVANYLIPQRNQCQSCHARQDSEGAPIELVLIGVKARHMNRTYDYGGDVGVRNQLDHFAELGMLTGAPPAATVPATYDFRPIETAGVSAIAAGDLEPAARGYLDINCAHCHNPHGIQGVTSQLFLNHDNADPFHLGVCKHPGSAGTGTGGFLFDIVPGDPDNSILYFRTHTAQVGAMMPLLGRSLTHDRGAELLHAWIAAMPAKVCATPPPP